MTIRVYINGQYIPHEYECSKWMVSEGMLYVYGGTGNKIIAIYNTCDWNIVKVIDD